MRKLFEVVAVLVLLIALTGCMATRTTTFYKNGAVDKVVVDKRPFLFDKGVDLGAKIIGLDLKLIDPNTGNPAPSANINYGDTRARTIPMTTGGDNVIEYFATYSETLTWSKSMWGAEVGTIDYTLNAAGLGVFAIGDASKPEKIAGILARINDLKAALDKAKPADVPAGPLLVPLANPVPAAPAVK